MSPSVPDLTTFAGVTILLAAIGGLWHGTRHRATKHSGQQALRLNRFWHRLLFAEQVCLAFAVSFFAFRAHGHEAVAAGVAVFASWRWMVFDTSHALADRQEPLYAGSVADTDALLARIPVAARLALYLALAIGSAVWLHHEVTA